MERLTNKREADHCRQNYQTRLEQGYPRNIPEERFLKLAAYEDTGVEPEEIEGLKNALCIGCPIPPCKIGDNVFCIRKLSGGVKRAMPGVVSEMYYVGTGMSLAIVVRQRGRGEWGKTVFPTLEAAEAALKKEAPRP